LPSSIQWYNVGITLITLQVAIVASGNANYTVGEVFPIMQQIKKEKKVSLSVPKFEQIPIIKKKKLTFWQKLLKLFGL